jgi:pyruvate/2-oxoglutarate dehydrogenase complex dihydrolipoamide dehydrogenase (E3) component
MNPDVMILAVGAKPFIPDIPGIEDPKVLWAGDIIADKDEAGDRVLVAGGGHVGCETALFLAEQGKKVVIIEMLGEVGIGLTKAAGIAMLQLLADHHVDIETEVKLEEVVNDGVTIIDKNNNRQKIEADTVALSFGLTPRREIVEQLQGLAQEVHVIGDCLRARKLINAVHDGFNIAVEI